MTRARRPPPDQSRSAVDGGQHQSIARIELLLSTVSAEPEHGMRLAEICRAANLGKATTHRLLSGLVTYGLLDLDPETGRYLPGLKIFAWASGAGNRFGLAALAGPRLRALAERFGDAVYLSVRQDDEAVCVDRVEGSFPIKTLALKVGDRRPLGIGAGSAAMLAALSDEAQRASLARTADARSRYPCSDADLAEMLRLARASGYAFVDGQVVPGISTVGVAIRTGPGNPIAAISVSAIADRMRRERRAEIAAAIRAETSALERSLGSGHRGSAEPDR